MTTFDVVAAVILASAIGAIWLSDCEAHAAETSAQAFATVVDPVEVLLDGGAEAPGQVQFDGRDFHAE